MPHHQGHGPSSHPWQRSIHRRQNQGHPFPSLACVTMYARSMRCLPRSACAASPWPLGARWVAWWHWNGRPSTPTWSTPSCSSPVLPLIQRYVSKCMSPFLLVCLFVSFFLFFCNPLSKALQRRNSYLFIYFFSSVYFSVIFNLSSRPPGTQVSNDMHIKSSYIL